MQQPLSDDEIEQAVLGYLAEHPRAMDSLDGIAEWWLPRRRLRVELEALRRVLDRLTERGVLARMDVDARGATPAKRTLYRLRG